MITLFQSPARRLLCLSGLLLAMSARADVLELANGDQYHGNLVSLTQSNAQFQSEVQGLMVIPRNKIAQITFGEVARAKPIKTEVAPFAPLVVTNQPATNAAAIQQLRTQNFDPKTINDVREQILGKADPAATAKFNEMMSGLMTGSLSVDDIRKQARKAIDDIKEAKKELGNSEGTEMFDSYLGILEKFVNESDQPAK